MSDNNNVGLKQIGQHMVTIYDVNSGNARLRLSTVSAREAIGRDPARYVETLPAGQTPGPTVLLESVMQGN